MHADGEVLFPYLQGLGLGIFEETQLHLQEELLRCLRIDGIRDDNGIIIDDGSNGHLPILGETVSNLGLNSPIPEYDLLEGEGDLFEAPQPTIEGETLPELDILTSSIPMVSSDESTITTDPLAVAVESQNLQGDVYYSCEKELLENPVIEELFSDLPGIEFQEQEEKEQIACNNDLVMELPIQKSVSLDCLDTSEWTDGVHPRHDFFNFQEMDFRDVIRMRRAFSEGDIKTLGTNLNLMKTGFIHLPADHVLNMENHKMEERREKLSRYMKKKAKRNFGRKIKEDLGPKVAAKGKIPPIHQEVFGSSHDTCIPEEKKSGKLMYACRKALADSQPRVRGRFAKTEECCETSK